MSARPRSAASIRQHYEIEKSLAAKLRSAPSNERSSLYRELYDELFKRVPDHPQLVARASMAERTAVAERQARFLASLCAPEPVFLEIGAGDCLLSLAFAARAKQVYAVDVSPEITSHIRPPANFQLLLSSGCDIPVPNGSVDLAFSNQLMEHLHPDDAREQLRNICVALRSGGSYFCVTPNRQSGPHDISRYFDREATGFHLHEYRIGELIALCRAAGFGRFRAYIGKDGWYLRVPIWLVKVVEAAVVPLPRRISRIAPIRLLLGIRLLATKTS